MKMTSKAQTLQRKVYNISRELSVLFPFGSMAVAQLEQDTQKGRCFESAVFAQLQFKPAGLILEPYWKCQMTNHSGAAGQHGNASFNTLSLPKTTGTGKNPPHCNVLFNVYLQRFIAIL